MDYYERNGRTCSQAIAVVTKNLCGEDLSKAADYALKLCTGRFMNE